MNTVAKAVHIREATPADAAGIARLHAESWQSAYRGVLSDDYLEKHALRERIAAWQERFSKNFQTPMFVLIAELAGETTGFACVFPEEDPVYGSFLDNLHVVPRLTGQGIGKKLLSAAAQRLVTNGSRAGLYLWVIEQNQRARRFYEKAGAEVVGTNPISMPDGQRISAARCYWPRPESLLI
ncbi:MAG: N-acetyltransferase family protein [Candidatus Acidiferrales bacterium]